MISGAAAGQLISFATLPILTRIFSPKEFGILAIFLAAIGMINTVSSMRYEMAIPLATSKKQAFEILILCLIFVTGTSVIVSCFILAAPAVYYDFNNVFWLLPAGVFTIGVFESLRYWAIRQKAYQDLGGIKIYQSIGRGAAQITSGIFSLGSFGLVLGEIIGQSAGITRILRKNHEYFCKSFFQIKKKNLLQTAFIHKSFPYLMAPASLINSAGLQVPTILLALCYGKDVAGWYFAAQRIVALPVQLIAKAAGDSMLAEVPKIAKQNPNIYKKIIKKYSKKVFLWGIGPCIILMVAAPAIFPIVLGSSWSESSKYLQILPLAYLTALAYSPINFSLIKKNELSLLWAAIRLVLTGGSIFTAYFLDQGPFHAVCYLTIASSISYFYSALMWERASQQISAR